MEQMTRITVRRLSDGNYNIGALAGRVDEADILCLADPWTRGECVPSAWRDWLTSRHVGDNCCENDRQANGTAQHSARVSRITLSDTCASFVNERQLPQQQKWGPAWAKSWCRRSDLLKTPLPITLVTMQARWCHLSVPFTVSTTFSHYWPLTGTQWLVVDGLDLFELHKWCYSLSLV